MLTCSFWLAGFLWLASVANGWQVTVEPDPNERQVQVGFHDGFETPHVAFFLKGDECDCGVQMLDHKRTFDTAHTGSGCEALHYRTGNGSKLYFTRTIERAPVLEDVNLVPSIWVKSNRGRAQLHARVVFPNAKDPRNGKPIARLIEGETYAEIGTWQRLAVTELYEQVVKKIPAWRKEFGKDFDPRMAYVDMLVINGYSGSGETRLWLDDLEITGVLDPTYGKQSSSKSPADKDPARRRAVVSGSKFLVDGRPMFVRAIEHRGEPFEFLARLGFNTIKLSESPTVEQMEEARRVGLWLIAPPPNFGESTGNLTAFDPVLAWNLGSQLSRSDLQAVQELANEVRKRDPIVRRPLVCQPETDWWRFGRETELLVASLPTLQTERELSELSGELRRRFDSARGVSPRWATIDTEPPASLQKQLEALVTRPAQPVAVDGQQIRLMTFAALSAGARGLWFRSSSSLAETNDLATMRAESLRLINAELNMIEPWISGSDHPLPVDTGDSKCEAVVWRTERARLIVAMARQRGQQFELGVGDGRPWKVSIPGVPQADKTYRVSLGGIAPIRAPVGPSGMNVLLENPGTIAMAVSTQDPMVVTHLQRSADETRAIAFDARNRLLQAWLQQTLLSNEQLLLLGQRYEPTTQHLRSAQAALLLSQREVSSGDFARALATLDVAENEVALARREPWERASTKFTSTLASPAGASFDWLPLHVELRIRLQNVPPGPNMLPGGDFENLEAVLAGGWRQRRYDTPEIETDVQLSTKNPHGGDHSLRLSAKPRASGGGKGAVGPIMVERPPVWITSPPLHVKRGQVLRVSGFAKSRDIATSTAQPTAGLLVFTSEGGPELGERFRNVDQWREFALFRAVTEDGPITITFALTGLGEASVDDCSVAIIDPSRPNSPTKANAVFRPDLPPSTGTRPAPRPR
jgi:hypothetical protein